MLGLGQDRLADVGVDRHPKREPHAALAQVPGQPGAGPGAVDADQDRLVGGGRWQLRQRQLDQAIRSSRRRGGVARSQQAASGSPGAWPRSR
jgi:hypothetical protein